MNEIKDLQPKEFFKYFTEIAAIPHGSGNTKRISDYCAAFAKAHNLEYIQDELNNIIIIKEAAEGYENAPAVIIQGHIDMVCEKESDCLIDFENDGLSLEYDGEYLYARGTTLGADDGVFAAYALALLADNTLKAPRIEAVFTVDEEIGLLGAAGIDVSMLKGKYMLNLDSDVEGMFLTSCAGGMTATCSLPVEYDESEGLEYSVKICGLLGGHSGAEIDKYRANANVLMGRLLYVLNNEIYFDIAALMGGSKDNAITRECELKILISKEDEQLMIDILKKLENDLRQEFESNDPGITIQLTRLGKKMDKILQPKHKEFIKIMLMLLPNGIQNMSSDIKGLVKTSLNLGILKLDEYECTMSFSVRSSSKTEKEALSDKLEYLTEFLGGDFYITGDYPAWPYKRESKLRELMCRNYKEMFGQEPKIEAIHAGLECGIFCDKIEGLDTISFGPTVLDIHTPKERMNVKSVERYYGFLKRILEDFKNIQA